MPKPVEMFFTIKGGDDKPRSSTITICLPAGTVANDALLFVNEMAGLLDPLALGNIINHGVTIGKGIFGSQVPVPLVDLENGARFIWRTLNNYPTRIRIPSFDTARYVSGTPQVDLADADVIAFNLAMENGIDLLPLGGTGLIQPVDTRDEDIVDLESATQNFVASKG